MKKRRKSTTAEGYANRIKHLKPFKKGFDPRRNIKGAPKKLPLLKELMKEMLGADSDTPINESPIAKVIQALIDETTNKSKGAQRANAAKELLDRAFGKVKAAEDEKSDQPIVWNETKTYSDKKK